MKLTEDMLRRAFAEKDAKRERDAVCGNEKLLRFVSPAGRAISSGISVRSLTWPSSAGTPCQGSRQT